MAETSKENTSVTPKLTAFQLVILVLSVYVLVALFIQVAVPLTRETSRRKASEIAGLFVWEA